MFSFMLTTGISNEISDIDRDEHGLTTESVSFPRKGVASKKKEIPSQKRQGTLRFLFFED